MGLPCLKATCALKAPKTTAAFVLQILSKLKCLLVLDFSMPQAFDRFPGGSDRTPLPNPQRWLFTLETCCGHPLPECGGSSWAARNSGLRKISTSLYGQSWCYFELSLCSSDALINPLCSANLALSDPPSANLTTS